MLGRLLFAVIGAVVVWLYTLWFTLATPEQALHAGMLGLGIGIAVAFVPLLRRDRRNKP